MKRVIAFALACVLIITSLPACGPAEAEKAATATQAAVDNFATQTALAPSATSTSLPPTPTHTATASLTPTPTPSATPIPPPDLSIYGIPFMVFTGWDGQALRVYGTNLDQEPIEYYLLSGEERPAYMPVWSPDGWAIAYLEYDQAAEKYTFSIYSMYDSQTYPLQEPVNVSYDYCWTYDHKYLVWSDHQPDGMEMDIYRMEVATGKITNLTEDSPVWDAFPACSPVSDQIAFVSDRALSGKGSDNIWLMDSQGKNLKQLTDTPTWENSFPAWSPDGGQIAYAHTGYPGMSEDTFAPEGLYVINVDGSGEHLLVERTAINIGRPLWSPDGQYIAYALDMLDASTLEIVPAAGGDVLWSSSLPGRNSQMSWSANSAYLLFTNQQEQAYRIYVIELANPNPVPLLPGPDNFLGQFAPSSIPIGSP